MKASVIIIGDELLIGQVTDTNSGFLARTMTPEGWEVDNIQVIADTREAITSAIDRAFTLTDVVLTTGGLGPTDDDITKHVLCEKFGGPLRHDPEVAANIRRVFSLRGLRLNPLTEAQAMVPASATVIQNPVGTAPVLWFETTRPHRVLVAMPGVPFETEHLFPREVFPRLRQAFPSPGAVAHRTFMVGGITESDLASRLAPWERSLPPHLHLAYLPTPGIIRLRLDGHATDPSRLNADIDSAIPELLRLLGPNLLAQADLTPARILLDRLTAAGLTIATAESCTGGNIARLLTSNPGASAAMAGGIVAYSNDVKMRLLGVSADTLAAHGAVSIPVVEQMALGACRALGASIAVATSGIAGPGGGTPDKPVGTVCIAAARADGAVISHTLHLPGNRTRVIDRASTEALLLPLRLL